MTICPFPRILSGLTALTLALAPHVAQADNHASGTFAIVDTAGNTVMALDLVETNGQISGGGVIPEGVLAHGPGIVTLRHGARLGDDLHLMMRLDAHDPAIADANTRLTVMNGAEFRLIYSGEITSGSFQSIPAGSVTIAPAPAAVAIAPTPRVAATPTPQAEARPPACIELDQVTAGIEATADNATRAEARNIKTLYGLANGDESGAKCQGALTEITAFLATPPKEDPPAQAPAPEPQDPEVCYAVAGALEDIAAKERATGNPVSATPAQIMATAGMISDANPFGENTAETCSRALTGLYEHLDNIRPPQTTADRPLRRSIDLPQGYRIEPFVNVNLGGKWRLAGGGDLMALWSQGRNAIVYEKGPDQRRVVWFWEPRAALADAGVNRGTLFIEGTRERGRFEGEARHFVKDCGVFVYPVTGRVREQETTIRITGDRPRVDENCTITGLAEHSFRMEFVADNPPGETNLNVAGSGNAIGTPDFGVWALRYEIRNIDRGGTLNVRRNPAVNARLIGELPRNARDIRILGEGCTPVIDQLAFDGMNRRQRMRMLSNRWCKIEWNDQKGWVYGRYLRPM